MKKLVGVLSVVVAAAGVYAAYQWVQLRTEREQNEALVKRVAALESAQLARAFAPPAPEPVALPPSVSPAPVAQGRSAAAPPPAPSGQQASRSSPQSGILQSMASPEGRELTRTMMRGMMLQMYPDVGKELNLTAQEAENLMNLLIKHQDDLTEDSMGLLAGQNDAGATQDLQRKLVQKQQAQEAELSAMLGSKYPKWQEYQSTQAARQQVDQLRTALSSTGNPLSEAQTKSLVTAFAAETRRSQQEERNWSSSPAAMTSPNMMEESIRRTTEQQRRLIDVAAPHLTSQQLTQYKQQTEQTIGMMRSMMDMMGPKGSKP